MLSVNGIYMKIVFDDMRRWSDVDPPYAHLLQALLLCVDHKNISGFCNVGAKSINCVQIGYIHVICLWYN